jgi:hypothetical protein
MPKIFKKSTLKSYKIFQIAFQLLLNSKAMTRVMNHLFLLKLKKVEKKSLEGRRMIYL